MAKARRKRSGSNPQLGPYRVQLRDAKGRFTSRYSLARLFRLYFDNQLVTGWIRFEEGLTSGEKQYFVLLEADREAKAAFEAEKAKKAKKRRPKRKPAKAPGKPKRKRVTEDEVVPEKPTGRRLQTVDDEEFAQRLEELKNIVDDIADTPVLGSQLVRHMEASSRGVKIETRESWVGNRKVIIRGNAIKQLEAAGMQKRNMIWWIASRYLRMLGDGFFEKVAFRYSRSIIRFRLYAVTNLQKHRHVIPAPQSAMDVVYRKGLRGAAKRKQRDIMVYQMVQAIMKCLYEDGRYQDGSLTSSDVFFQAISPSSMSIGTRSTGKQVFRLGFTLSLQLD